MLNFLNEPYTFLNSRRNLPRITLLILVIGFLFEYNLIPFEREPDEHKYAYWLISLFHVGTAALVYFLYSFIIGLLINEDDWKVWKEIVMMAGLLFFIGVAEFLIRDLIYMNVDNWRWVYFFTEVWHAYLSGSVVMFLVITVAYKLNLIKYQKSANELNTDHEQPIGTQLASIKTGVAADDFAIDLNALICLRAEGNYVEFFVDNEESTQRLVKRISLQSALDQVSASKNICKTHRAFAVNLAKVKTVTGNAGGYQLGLSGVDFSVPVSRSHIDSFDQMMK